VVALEFLGQRHVFDMAKVAEKQYFDLADDYKLHCQTLPMWPRQWRKYRSPKDLRWRSVAFTDHSRSKVPRKPGVYAFSVRPSVANLEISYLIYIGMTDRTLRERFVEYLGERDPDRGRPKLTQLFRRYKGFVVLPAKTGHLS